MSSALALGTLTTQQSVEWRQQPGDTNCTARAGYTWSHLLVLFVLGDGAEEVWVVLPVVAGDAALGAVADHHGAEVLAHPGDGLHGVGAGGAQHPHLYTGLLVLTGRPVNRPAGRPAKTIVLAGQKRPKLNISTNMHYFA